MFEIFSVLAYTFMILKNIESMNHLKTYQIGGKTCIDFDLGHGQQWMILEITAFFVNMFILSVNLLISLIPNKRLKKALFKRRIVRNIKILQCITEHKNSLSLQEQEKYQYRIINEKDPKQIHREFEEIKLSMQKHFPEPNE